MNSVYLYGEPVEIIKDIKIFKEMTFEESAFICGLIKDKRPKTIVEVGVAAGGTSAVILNCIRKLKLDSKLIPLIKEKSIIEIKVKRQVILQKN